jgi:hypothetical protein
MTRREAAEQQERDKAQARRRAQQHQDKNDMWAATMIAETQLQYSQRGSQSQTQLVPNTQLDALLLQLSKTLSILSPGDSASESSTDSDVNAEPRSVLELQLPWL